MSDKYYISRQALLAKIFDLPKPKTDKTYWDGVDDVSDLISRLPYVIECEDCISLADAIEFFKDDDYVVNELKNLVSVMPKPNKWIPVSQPPEKSGEYLVSMHYVTHDVVAVASYATDLHKVDEYNFPKHEVGWYNYDSEYGYYKIENVIVAYMPLPEPYKQEVKE